MLTIEFAHPWFLALLALVPPLLLCWVWRRRRGIRFPALALVRALPGGRSRGAWWGGLLLRGLALMLLIVALAGPRSPDLQSRLPTEGIAIEMVVDVSGSMEEDDFERDGKKITRLDAVKYVLQLFVLGGELPDGTRLDGRPSDLVGLVMFGTHPDSICPPTLSHAVLIEMLQREKPRSLEEAHTNISDALVLALLRLEGTKVKKKVLVLLSDGEHNVPVDQTGSKLTPREAAQLGGNRGITIYTIDAAGPVESRREIGANEDSARVRAEGIRTLREIARIGQGEYFQARNTDSLTRVYEKIDELERSRIETYQYRRYHDYYPWLGLGAFVSLMAIFVLELTWWRRVP